MKARRDVSFRSLSFFQGTFPPLGNRSGRKTPRVGSIASSFFCRLECRAKPFVDRVDLPPQFRAFKDEEETDS